jgi:hypothetical protein
MALDPVDIDIRMKQNVSEEAGKASNAFVQFAGDVSREGNAIDRVLKKLGYTTGESAEKIQQKLREQVRESKAAIREMESLLNSLPGAAKKQTGYRRQETLTELAAVKKALSEEKLVLTELEGKLDAAGEASRRLVTQKNDLREEMVRLKIAGKENTDEYRRMAEEMAILENATQEVGKQMKLLGKSDNIFQGVLGGLTGVAGMLTAGAGAAELFGEKSKDLEEVQARLQSLMSITIGLQGTYNAFLETAALRTVVVAGAKRLWTAAQTALNVQLGLSATLSKVLMTGGIGLLVAAITALVVLYQRWNREQKEINKARMEGVKSVQSEIANVRSLEAVLKNSNNTYDARMSALNELRKIMPSYNAMLDREGALIEDNTGAL